MLTWEPLAKLFLSVKLGATYFMLLVLYLGQLIFGLSTAFCAVEMLFHQG